MANKKSTIYKSLVRSRKERRLLYRMLFAVILCSSILTLFTTAVQLYHSYQTDLDTIDQNFDFVTKSYLPAISASVYMVNLEQLNIQLAGVLQLTDMVYVQVREPRGEYVFTLSAGDSTAQRDLVREYPLSYRLPSGQSFSCGTMLLAANLNKVWKRLWGRIFVILLTNGVKVFIASILILFILHFLLGRHITHITQYFSRWRPDKPSDALVLNRRASRIKNPDELDKLVDSINRIRLKIIEFISEKDKAVEALKNSESNIRLITDSLPVLISYIDRDLRYRYNNKAYSKWFDIERDQISGHHVKDILGEDLFKVVHPFLQRAFAGNRVTFETELRKNGKNYAFEVTYIPDRTNGDVNGLYALAQDLSEKKQRQVELQQHRTELAHVSRLAAMGELAASIAHELNQPLTAILSNAQAGIRFIDKNIVDMNEIKDILRDIASDDVRAGQVIKKLRDFLSRGELNQRLGNMNDIIADVVMLVNSDIVTRNVFMQLDLEPNLSAVRIDYIQMQQVLLNLILNALDALEKMPLGSRQLTIRTVNQDDQTVLVTVADSGIGLDAELLPRIFEPFITTKSEGMGMGLSINRSIIEAHDGEIWAQNNPDGGATFYFTLPIPDRLNEEEMNGQ